MQDELTDWSIALLKCSNCNGEIIRQNGEVLLCKTCGVTYPVCNGVPMMLPAENFLDAAQIIADASGGLDHEAVATALASANRYWLRDPTLRGEFSQIIDRYASFFLPADSAVDTARPTIETIAHYFNGHFGPNQSAFRSIRIRNNSKTLLTSDGIEPFFVSYFMFDEAGNRLTDGPRSRLPVELRPGQELTIPVHIIAPEQPGNYRIRLLLVHEHVRWYEECPLLDTELVVNLQPRFCDTIEHVSHEGFFDFERDLTYCGEVLEIASNFVQKLNFTEMPLKILEIACGSDPQTLRHYQAGSQVIAMDLCFPQVQIASLRYARSETVPINKYQFVSGDLASAPIKTGVFDMVVISAALHHFTDVVQALLTMKSFLNNHGCIVLLREPSKVCVDDPTYISELKSGFNEQQFELDEYKTMYEISGLIPIYQKVHFECSYKSILKKIS